MLSFAVNNADVRHSRSSRKARHTRLLVIPNFVPVYMHQNPKKLTMLSAHQHLPCGLKEHLNKACSAICGNDKSVDL